MLIMFSLELNEKSVVRLHVCDVSSSVDDEKKKTQQKNKHFPLCEIEGRDRCNSVKHRVRVAFVDILAFT